MPIHNEDHQGLSKDHVDKVGDSEDEELDEELDVVQGGATNGVDHDVVNVVLRFQDVHALLLDHRQSSPQFAHHEELLFH